MYLSESILKRSFSAISHIGPDAGKTRLERISAVSRFFACANILQKKLKNTVNLAPNEQDRDDFITAVGDMIGIGDGWLYTPDFKHREVKKDYGVGNNFLTTQVSRSKGRSVEYPNRPAPLLQLNNQIASLHPESANNLREKFNWDSIAAAFGVWLCRSDDLGQVEDRTSIVAAINALNSGRFGVSVSDLIKVTEQDLALLQEANKPQIQSTVVNTENFGAVQDAAEVQGRKDGPSQADIGVNYLFYGAPATGKSHKVNLLAGTVNVIRTVFHPDTQNSDFFGSLKPRMNGDKIEYGFAAGPFSEALKASLLMPEERHVLIIEELNRAPAAAVFGEIFQLLDRVPETGASFYSIAFPSPESEAWFNDQDDLKIPELYIPGNLTIYATMNSADQGVFPLDTAFRRRWTQEYLPLYGDNPPTGDVEIRGLKGIPRQISWDKFVRALNDFLIDEFDAAEDRLLGHWFVRPHELGKGVPEKILLYLWDDLLRHEDRFILFNKTAGRTYGQLHQAHTEGAIIFSERFLSILNDLVDNSGD